MKSFTSFFIVFFLLPLFCFSTVPSVLSFYTDPSLFPDNNVVAIQQDSRDCIYLGTRYGLISYDGVQKKRYEHAPFDDTTLRSSQIQTMFMDESDVLWIGTYDGLERFDTKNETIEHYPSSNEVISAIYRDSKKRLWVGTLNGLHLYEEPEDKNFVVFSNQKGDRFIGNNTIRAISEDSHGVIYASTYDGVWEYNETHGFFTRVGLLPENCPGKTGVVYDFIEDNSTYWIAVWGVGLVHVYPQLQEYYVHSLPDNNIYVLYDNFTDDMYIAAGTWGGGVFVLNKATKEVYAHTGTPGHEGSLSNNVVYDIFVDRYDMMFVGTAGALNLVDLNNLENEIAAPLYGRRRTDADSRLRQNIQSVITVDNTVWAASANFLLKHTYTADRDPQLFCLCSEKVPGVTKGLLIYSIEPAGESRLWVGTNEGLFLFDIETGQFTAVRLYNAAVKDHASLLIRSLCCEDDGSVWIGTFNGGLYYFHPEKGIINNFRHTPHPASLINNIVYFVKRDTHGNIWIGTNRGLSRYRPDTEDFVSYTYDTYNPNSISANRVDSFCEDSEGALWFGTKDGGVCKFDPSTELFVTYTTADGLSSNQIVGIADTGQGTLWIATAKDLHLFDTKKETIQSYNIKEVKRNGYFSCPPARSYDGDMFFFGTHRGVIKIAQKMLDFFSLQLIPVRIREISVNGENFDIHTAPKPFSFNYKDNDFEFLFSGPYSSPLKSTVYAYKLSGFDTKWTVTTDRNHATYTNLPPGTYTFSVKNIADPYAVSDTFSFTIRASVFFSPIMVWIYLLLIAFVLFSVYKINRLYWFQRYASILEEKQLVLIQDNFTLKELSMLDHLTGIGNRRYIDTMGVKLWETAIEHDVSLAVLMLDIDFFKRYNDSYGHQAGDDLLRLIGSSLKSRIRTETDLLGRYGGEEFLIVLYNVTTEKAVQIADGIRKTIEVLHEKHGDSMIGRVTLSIGLFCANPADVDSFDAMIYRADHALYTAKGNGRNRVVSYVDTDAESEDSQF